jgi:isopenicillin N synthase-like dioxygenase
MGKFYTDPDYDRQSHLKSFDDSKTGVKGLVDSGATEIPPIFLHHGLKIEQTSPTHQPTIPTIDLEGIINGDETVRSEIIAKIKEASENWGFFQIVNHGIPQSAMDGVIDGVGRFHEQESEVKKELYTRDFTKKFVYNSNFDLYKAPASNWRDTIFCVMAPQPPKPEDFPVVCRDSIIEYSNHVKNLGSTLFELLSEALGLEPNHLKEIGCTEGLFLIGHYYPACPEPELTLGTSNHTDSGFLTLLIQDQIGGLQILHQDQWIDIPPLPGALVINIADLLQLITNDKFKSVNHRVLAKNIGPRISVACFFRTQFGEGMGSWVYGPLQELITEENPAVYRETTTTEYLTHYYTKGLDGISALSRFKIA